MPILSVIAKNPAYQTPQRANVVMLQSSHIMHKHTNFKIFLLLCCVALIVFQFFDDMTIIASPTKKEKARAELCQIFQMAKVGGNIDDLIKHVNLNNFRFIRKQETNWVVYRSPAELPGLTTQWALFIFLEDRTIKRIELRNEDGKNESCRGYEKL